MVSAYQVLFVVVFSTTVIQPAIQEGCVPGTVTNMELSANWVGSLTLSWDQSPDEQCDISYYIVYVIIYNTTLQTTYTVTERKVEVGHLSSCEPYTFQVQQVSSDNVTGPIGALSLTTPPPSAADLVVVHLNVIPGTRNVTLEWSLESQWMPCAKHFMVLIYDEDTDVSTDIYTTNPSITITDIVPCDRYIFGLRAVFGLEVQGPLTLVQHWSMQSVTTPPVLANVTLGETSVDLTWHLEEYSKNRCAISSLILDGSPSFNVTYEIDNQDTRTPMSITIEDLDPDSLYYFRATVINSAGMSDPLAMAVQTLDSS